MHKDELSLDDLILLFSGIGMLISFIMLVGIAGGVDCDKITLFDAAKKGIVWCIVMTLSVTGLMKVEKDDEEDEYGNL